MTVEPHMNTRIARIAPAVAVTVVGLSLVLYAGPQQSAEQAPGRQSQSEQTQPREQTQEPARRPAVRSEAEIQTNNKVQELLEKIETRMREAKSARTHIRQEVQMGGQKFSAEGEYVWAEGNRMRLELNVRVSDVTARLLEVCDGRDQWHVEEILDVKKVEHLDLEQCSDVLDDPDFDPVQKRAFLDARGFGGLAPFVDSLQEFFVFTELKEVEEGGKKLLVATGTWNEEKLGGEDQPPAAEAASAEQPGQTQQEQQQEEQRFSVLNLPPEMPSTIILWIDPEIPWIVRMEMIAERAPKNRPGRLLLEFSTPEFSDEISRDLFAYQPPDDVRVADRTGVVIETLKLVLQQKKASEQESSSATTPARPTPSSGGGLLGPTRAPEKSGASKDTSPESKASPTPSGGATKPQADGR